MQETWVRSLGREDPLEKEMATHSSTLAWRIPWTEEPGGLHSSRGHKELDTTEQLHYAHSRICVIMSIKKTTANPQSYSFKWIIFLNHLVIEFKSYSWLLYFYNNILDWQTFFSTTKWYSDLGFDILGIQSYLVSCHYGDQNQLQEKKCKKAKWLSEEALQISEKRREAKGKGEKERYTHLNAEFQKNSKER